LRYPRMCAMLMLQFLAIIPTHLRFGFPQQDFFSETARLPRQYFNIAFPTSTATRPDYIHLKL
uniref:Secreted protein n=1 Tax=Taenia asiatica TaxID=60517 RepID=A0A0R3WGN8_TAEAS